MTETMGPEERKKLLDIAEAWLKLADDAAKAAAKQNGPPPARRASLVNCAQARGLPI
jgi:hypothetical protein